MSDLAQVYDTMEATQEIEKGKAEKNVSWLSGRCVALHEEVEESKRLLEEELEKKQWLVTTLEAASNSVKEDEEESKEKGDEEDEMEMLAEQDREHFALEEEDLMGYLMPLDFGLELHAKTLCR